MTVCLSGFMGSGKSTLGRALADALGDWCFIDLDSYIEQQAGKTIPDLFREAGEAAFRSMERDCLQEILSSSRTQRVLALGGGTLMTPACAALVREKAFCIYLQASEETLVGNLRDAGTAGRPLLSEASGEAALRKRVSALMAQRAATYEACADYILSTDGRTAGELLQELCSLFPRPDADASI